MDCNFAYSAPPRCAAWVPTLNAALFLLALATSAASTGTPGRRTYIVELERPAAAVEFSREGAKSQGAPVRLDPSEPALRRYVGELDHERTAVLGTLSASLKRRATPRFEYRYAFNGFAIELAAQEARDLARAPGVRSVQVEKTHTLLTFGTPDMVGATAAWNSPGSNTRGEGMVIGVIDSGTNYAHPAFAATDVDGYRHGNPRGRYYGICAPPRNAPACNDKRIGVYDFSDPAGTGGDTDGHGSHVSSIALGNARAHTASGGAAGSVATRLSGIAPRANLISYKVDGDGSVTDSSVIMALEQAILDQVDVVSYSLGYAPADPWTALQGVSQDPSNVAVTNVVRAGIAFAAAAGNDGPNTRFGGPASLPWVATVGSTTRDRAFGPALTGLTGSVSPPVPQFAGAGISTPYGPARIVLGAQFGSAECAIGSDPDLNATGISSPFAGRVFNGEIVVCDRGFHSRAAKVVNAKNAGAGGVILVNSQDQGDTYVSDAYQLPTMQIGFAAGQQLKAWVTASAGSASGRIGSYQLLQSNAFGPILSTFSSSGPDLGRIFMLRPSLTAPGQATLAASHQTTLEVAFSGTSMSTPHVAGMLALLRQGRRNETPMTLMSALELTADPGVRVNPAGRMATSIEQGAGSARIDRALQAGLVLPLTMVDFERENPRTGGDPSRLNSAALYDESCNGGCTFTRRVRAWRAGTYNASASIEAGAAIAVSPATFTLAVGQEQALTIDVDVNDPRFFERFAFGAVDVVATDASIPASRMTVSVRKPLASYPAALDFAIGADRGYIDVPMTGRSNDGEIRFRVNGPVAATRATPSLAPQASAFYWLDLASNGEVRAEITESTAGDWDLYVGVDRNNNQIADSDEYLCQSISIISVEDCRVSGAAPGRYFVRVYSYGSPNANDTGVVHFAAIPNDAGGNRRGHATGPARLALDQAFTMRLGFDVGGMHANDRAYGSVDLLRGDDGSAFAALPLLLRRTAVATPRDFYLPPGQTRRLLLPAGGDFDNMVIDVPAGAASLTVEMRGSEGNAGLYLAKAPSADIGRSLPTAPPIAAAAVSADGPDSNETLLLSAPQLTPGRWYVVARNPGSSAVAVDLTARITGAETSPFAFEVWYNPARDGHGLFFTRAGNSAQMVWYTYDDAGQPIWYLAFPDGITGTEGAVSSDLFRYVWAGGEAHGTRVGRVTLTRQSGRLVFTWEVDGLSGSEPMQLLTSSACVGASGSAFDPSGLWFEPARSGYGANIFTRPEVDFVVLYIYGADGRARWVLGQNPAFGNSPLALYQYSGFCPGCATVPVSRRDAGIFSRTFDASSGSGVSGHWTISANFLSPLAGAWTANNVPTQLLTNRKACNP